MSSRDRDDLSRRLLEDDDEDRHHQDDRINTARVDMDGGYGTFGDTEEDVR